MYILADAMTGGWIAGLAILAVALIIAAVCLIAGVGMAAKGASYDKESGWALIIGTVIVSAIFGGIWLWASWPLAYDYHHWVDKTIVVKRTNSRLLTDSNGDLQQKVVVTDDDGHFYGINETRATLLQPGMKVHLRCKKAYDFGVPRAAHGWDCKWNQVGDLNA